MYIIPFIIFRANRQFLARIIEEAIGREAIDAAMEAAGMKPTPAPTMYELMYVVRTKPPSGRWEDAIRVIVERCGGRIASEDSNVKLKEEKQS